MSPPATGRLPKERRLTDKSQFDLVYRERLRVSDALFIVIARPNEVGHVRLGMAVGRRAAGSAVNRNRVKRVVREAFRTRQQDLPPVDLVVNAKPAAARAANSELTSSVAALWTRIRERCVRS